MVKKSIDWLIEKYKINDYIDLELDLYVTGLTVALIEVINFCNLYGVGLVLHHYDKLLDIYYKQLRVFKIFFLSADLNI